MSGTYALCVAALCRLAVFLGLLRCEIWWRKRRRPGPLPNCCEALHGRLLLALHDSKTYEASALSSADELQATAIAVNSNWSSKGISPLHDDFYQPLDFRARAAEYFESPRDLQEVDLEFDPLVGGGRGGCRSTIDLDDSYLLDIDPPKAAEDEEWTDEMADEMIREAWGFLDIESAEDKEDERFGGYTKAELAEMMELLGLEWPSDEETSEDEAEGNTAGSSADPEPKQKAPALRVSWADIEDDDGGEDYYDEEFERLHDLDWVQTAVPSPFDTSAPAKLEEEADGIDVPEADAEDPQPKKRRQRKRGRKNKAAPLNSKPMRAAAAAAAAAAADGCRWPPCPWRIKQGIEQELH
jgi:hypothetical protein